MKSLVVYESMYGNTHLIAAAVAEGLAEAGATAVLPVAEVDRAALEGVDLLVVGGPTHVHGLSRARTRKAAIDSARSPDKELTLEPNATGRGLRDWFEALGDVSAQSGAFDTRVDMPVVLTGRAGRGIAKQLRRHGCVLVAKPESFLVDRSNRLIAGEEERARRWGRELVKRLGYGVPASAV